MWDPHPAPGAQKRQKEQSVKTFCGFAPYTPSPSVQRAAEVLGTGHGSCGRSRWVEIHQLGGQYPSSFSTTWEGNLPAAAPWSHFAIPEEQQGSNAANVYTLFVPAGLGRKQQKRGGGGRRQGVNSERILNSLQ